MSVSICKELSRHETRTRTRSGAVSDTPSADSQSPRPLAPAPATAQSSPQPFLPTDADPQGVLIDPFRGGTGLKRLLEKTRAIEAARAKSPHPNDSGETDASQPPPEPVRPLSPDEQVEIVSQFREQGLVRLYQMIGGKEPSPHAVAAAGLGFRDWMQACGDPTDPLERKLAEICLLTSVAGSEFMGRSLRTDVVPQALMLSRAATGMLAQSTKAALAIAKLRESRAKVAGAPETHSDHSADQPRCATRLTSNPSQLAQHMPDAAELNQNTIRHSEVHEVPHAA